MAKFRIIGLLALAAIVTFVLVLLGTSGRGSNGARISLLPKPPTLGSSSVVVSQTTPGSTPAATPQGAQGTPGPAGEVAAETAEAVILPGPATPDTSQPPVSMTADQLRPTRIQAPAIGLDAPVVEVGYKIVMVGGKEATSWVVPANAAGFHKGSAYPGEVGNTVISGHHNMGSEVFRYVVDLKVGDEIILWVGDKDFHYRVTETHLLQEAGVSDEQRIANGKWIAPTQDERLTLVTCWPYSGNSHRVIVVAKPVR